MISVKRRPRLGWRAASALGVALVASLVATVMPAVTLPRAEAAVHGYFMNLNGFIAGNYLSSDGQSYVYCIEPGADEPYGNQAAPVRMSELPSYDGDLGNLSTQWNGSIWDGPVSGAALRQMNYIMWVYGQTTNAEQAATVQFAVWLLRRGPGTSPWLDHHINWVTNLGHGWLIDSAELMIAEAQNAAVPAQAPQPTALSLGPVSYAADASGAAVASGTLGFPASTHSLGLSGATFDSGATQHSPSSGSAGNVNWRATLHPDGWQRYHEVSATAQWQRSVQSWPDEVLVHPPAVGNQQYLGAGISPVTEVQQLALEPVSLRLDTQFTPALSTQVPNRFVAFGDSFADSVTFGVSDGSAPWATRAGGDGSTEFAPVTAEGVLFGPFAHPPSPADTAPERAPIAARASVVAVSGPGSYEVDSGVHADESGYYSWVWSIREVDQSEAVRSGSIIPSGYEFHDRFGQSEEGQVVPMSLRWTTELSEQELSLQDLLLRDSVTLSLQRGAWLRGETGTRMPVTVRLTVFESAEQPEQQAQVPADALEIARGSVTFTEAGTATADPIVLPFETRGWVSVQACVVAEDQLAEVQGYVEEWCDDFGVPAETARIALPEVRTEAQPHAQLGEIFHDTAVVTGELPARSSIGFRFYLEPVAGEEKMDESWKPVRDESGRVAVWTEHELQQLTAEERCLAQPVAETHRVQVFEPGSVRSPGVLAGGVGAGFWVEDLTTEHPETGETVELHRGACGLENERTIITEPETPSPVTPPAPTSTPSENPSDRPAPKSKVAAPAEPLGTSQLVQTGATLAGAAALPTAVLLIGVGLLIAGVVRQRRRVEGGDC